MEVWLFFKAMWAGISIDQMCLFGLALYCGHQTRMITKLQYQYNQLDKLTLAQSIIQHMTTGVKLTQNHRTGDYDIVNPMLDNVQTPPEE